MLHEEKGNQNVKLFAGKNTSFLNVYFCLFLEKYLFELHILKKLRLLQAELRLYRIQYYPGEHSF